MRPILATPLLVGCLVAGLAGPVTARPAYDCPNANSGFERVDPAGAWAVTVVGITEMGLTVEEFAALVGAGSAQELETYYTANLFGRFDVNGSGYICMKDLPNTPGNLPVKFNAVDDDAAH